MRILSAFCGMLALALAAPASAEETAKSMLAEIDAKSENATGNMIFIAGIGNGISWTNTMMKETGRSPLYCPPPDQGFSGEEYVAMLREFVRGKTREADLPVGFALLLTLGSKFPCPK